MVTIGQVITINSYVVKVVVKPNGLRLLIGLLEWPLIPETNIVDRILVPGKNGWCQIRDGRVWRLLNFVEIVGVTSKLDVILQIGRFQAEFIGLYDERLHKSRNGNHSDEVKRNINAGSNCQGLPTWAKEIEGEKDAG